MSRLSRAGARSGARARAAAWLKSLAPLAALLLVAGAFTGCGKEKGAASFYNPLDPGNRPDLAVPVNLTVQAGTDRLQLEWELPEGYAGPAIDEYAVFRRQVDDAGVTIDRQFLLTRLTGTSYLDVTVKNGLHYVYNVAAGSQGQFGGRSRDARGTPALFNMILNDDAPATRDPRVSVQFVAPAGTEAVKIYEQPDATDIPWRPVGQGTTWTLLPGDGIHTVYARFRLPGGDDILATDPKLPQVSIAKSTLRRTVREAIKALTPDERASASLQARNLLEQQSAWQNSNSIFFYAPLMEELDIWPLLEDSLNAGKIVCLPRFDPVAQSYVACRIENLTTDVASGQFGIREPAAHCAPFPLNQLDLVLVPGVAFDLRGRRLGRGKGFYDRLLADASGLKCGVAFDEQIVIEIPVEPHDVSVNCILTPTRWIEP